MKINMDDSRIRTIAQLRTLLKGTQKLDLSLRQAEVKDKYRFIRQVIKRFHYDQLSKADKRVVRQYIVKLTGYKHTQLNRLIKRAKQGTLQSIPYHRVNSHHVYIGSDIKLLEKTDELHLRLNGLATKEIMRREVEVFGHSKYRTIARVSIAHLYNLRKSPVYKSHWINHTKPKIVPIGETHPPENYGLPGSIRVDTVHQREIYHINAVDEVTQWEVVHCVPVICERCMIPALESMLAQFPFVVFNFHSDRGGENINYKVSSLLQRSFIKQTKSRSRHPNDNALVETKNGHVIRKNMGWEHINQSMCDEINRYYYRYFNPYLNYHRPSLFSNQVKVDQHGRSRHVYDQAIVPYEKLKQIIKQQTKSKRRILKANTTLAKLDILAYQHSDNEFAKILRKEEEKLFNLINKSNRQNGSR